MATTPDQQNELLLQQIEEKHKSALVVEALHNIGRLTGEGNIDAKWQHVIGGMNRLPNITPLPVSKEMQGLVLFTRPELNLTTGNIGNIRLLNHLLAKSPQSIQHAVRRILDPVLQRTDRGGDQSHLVDMYSPYISLLSNTIVTMSQPPDIGLTAYNSPEGIHKEQWLMNEGIGFVNGRYDLTCTFDNPKGAMVLVLIHAWILYCSYLRLGINGGVFPYPHASFYGVMDYFTRIERFKFDESGRYIVQWFHTGASFPTNLSIGAGFGYNREEAYETENKQLSVQFACVGAVYQDPIQLIEFNMRYENFNPGFRPEVRNNYYIQIDYKDIAEFNYLGYPHINLRNNEMTWWVPKEIYNGVVAGRDALSRDTRGLY